MTYCLDVEMFIGEVAKRREIWDLDSEDNRHKSRKQRAWAQIARVFIADFEDMPDGERQDVCEYRSIAVTLRDWMFYQHIGSRAKLWSTI